MADNGGPTLTHLPQEDSPAVDIVEVADHEPVDQRGVPRPRGDGWDAGSVERHPGGPIEVTTTEDTIDADDGLVSLREAMIAASENPGGDRIEIQDGDYRLTLGCDVEEPGHVPTVLGEVGDLDHVNGSLEVVGVGPGRPIIRGCETGRRLIENTSTEAMRIENLRLTGGRSDHGAAVTAVGPVEIVRGVVDDNRSVPIDSPDDDRTKHGRGGALNVDGALVIRDSEIVDNYGGRSGGAIWAGEALTVQDSELARNETPAQGGAIFSAGRVVVEGSRLTENVAPLAAAIDAQGSDQMVLRDSIVERNESTWTSGVIGNDWLIEDTVFRENVTTFGGGAVRALRLAVHRSQFVDNVSRDNGWGWSGASAIEAGTATVVESTIVGNESMGLQEIDGGAVLADQLTLRSSTVADNDLTAGRGAGIATRAGSGAPETEIVDSTVSGNTVATGSGGGVHTAGDLSIVRSTIASNSAESGSNIDVGEEARVSIQGSIIDDPVGAPSCPAPLELVSDSLDSDGSCSSSESSNVRRGVDAGLGPLAANGGLTPTHLPSPTSPAIDLVPIDRCGEPIEDDQRDLPRPVGPSCDAGAVELQPGEDLPDPNLTDLPAGHW
ncbi:MAG: choice-of-anchor Q domain-containing protein, partial [Actinomycetota bacterium]